MNKILQIIIIFGCILSTVVSCREDLGDKRYITSEKLQISDFLANRDNMSSMVALLNRTGYFNLLNSYGRYTVFAPTDDAWKTYLSSIGKNSIDDLSREECTALFEFHVLYSSVNLKAQNTGLLMHQDTTMNGIQHYVDLSGGFNNIVMNKTSHVGESWELPNGYLYTVSAVFVPRPANIYDYLAQGGYRLFSEAVTAAGLKDTLQKIDIPYYANSLATYTPIVTLFAEPDDVFAREGINSLQQLKDAVWAKSQPAASSPDEALRDFVDYHIPWILIDNTDFYVDLRRLTSSMFKAENINMVARNRTTVVSVAASNQLSPDPVLNGAIKLNLLKSDVSFKNGVVHELNHVMYIENKAEPQEVVFECENTWLSRYTPLGWERIYIDAAYDKLRASGNPRASSNVSFSSSFYTAQNTGYALRIESGEKGLWIDFFIRNLPAGKYEVYLNYRRVKNTVSQKVNVYAREVSDAYNWKTQLLFSGLDMAHDGASAEDDRIGKYPEFRQNAKLGEIDHKTFGDYVIRFVHADSRGAYYDNIILKPVAPEQEP